MKKLLIVSLLLCSTIAFGQKKDTTTNVKKVNQDSIAILSMADIVSFNEELKNLPYKDYQKLTPENTLQYLVAWIQQKKAKK